jgi:hypothetical protein
MGIFDIVLHGRGIGIQGWNKQKAGKEGNAKKCTDSEARKNVPQDSANSIPAEKTGLSPGMLRRFHGFWKKFLLFCRFPGIIN